MWPLQMIIPYSTRDSTIFPYEKLDYPFQCWTTKMCQWNMIRRCISQEKPREISSLMLVAHGADIPTFIISGFVIGYPKSYGFAWGFFSSFLNMATIWGYISCFFNPLWFMIESPFVHHFEWFQFDPFWGKKGTPYPISRYLWFVSPGLAFVAFPIAISQMPGSFFFLPWPGRTSVFHGAQGKAGCGRQYNFHGSYKVVPHSS